MSGTKETAESANEEDQLLAFDPDEDNNAEISGEKHLDTPSVMAAKAPVSDSNISMLHADVKLLSSAILTLSKIDKFEDLPSKGKGKGKGKRLSDDQEHQHGFPAKKPAKDGSSSSSDQPALEKEEDIDTHG